MLGSRVGCWKRDMGLRISASENSAGPGVPKFYSPLPENKGGESSFNRMSLALRQV